MNAALRRRLLMAALALSLAATAWVASREEEAAVQVQALLEKPKPKSNSPRPNLPAGWPAALVAPASDDGPAWPVPDAIARQSWGLAAIAQPQSEEPPPVNTKAAKLESAAEAAPAPAPPIAYSLVGRMDEAGRPRIVLSNAQRTLVLGVGELIDQQWRIDAIGPSGAQLTWLAGGQKQNLAYSNPSS